MNPIAGIISPRWMTGKPDHDWLPYARLFFSSVTTSLLFFIPLFRWLPWYLAVLATVFTLLFLCPRNSFLFYKTKQWSMCVCVHICMYVRICVEKYVTLTLLPKLFLMKIKLFTPASLAELVPKNNSWCHLVKHTDGLKILRIQVSFYGALFEAHLFVFNVKRYDLQCCKRYVLVPGCVKFSILSWKWIIWD